jgi:hypothetical protein
MKAFVLAGSILFPLLATAEPPFPEEMLRGQSAQYQKGFRDGFREAVRLMGTGGPVRERKLEIESAAYGWGPRRCDFTRSLAAAADGRDEYFLRAHNGLCGDPAPGKDKDAVIHYRCGRSQVTVNVKEGGAATLRCK